MTNIDIVPRVIAAKFLRSIHAKITNATMSNIKRSLLMLAVFSPSAFPTVIGAVRTPVAIVFASDSQASLPSGERARDMCKILNYGTHAITMSGVAAQDFVQFYPFDIVRRELSGRITPTRVSKFIESIRTKAFEAAQWEFSNRPRVYEKYLAFGPLTVVIAWLDRSILRMQQIAFLVKPGPDGPMDIDFIQRTCPGDCATGVIVILSGPKSEQDRYYSSLPKTFGRAPVSTAKGYVDELIRRFPKEYAGPFQTIKGDRRGFKWIDRPDFCEEEEK